MYLYSVFFGKDQDCPAVITPENYEPVGTVRGQTPSHATRRWNEGNFKSVRKNRHRRLQTGDVFKLLNTEDPVYWIYTHSGVWATVSVAPEKPEEY